jgi:hypothetical protein
MASVRSSWLIGSARIPATTLTIDAVDYVWPAGNYYLRHTTPALSMIATLEGILVDAGVAGASVTVGKDRLVHIAYTAGWDFAFSWPADGLIKGLLGFVFTIGASPTQAADYVSPLLWSPAQPERPTEAPLGVPGRVVYDTRLSTSPSGVMIADSHHAQTINSFDWSYVPMDRFQSTATGIAAGGHFTRFYDQVMRKAQKFFLYREVVEDDADAGAVTWTASPLGPYSLRTGNNTRGMSWAFRRSRGLENADRRVEVSVDTIVVPEWGAL